MRKFTTLGPALVVLLTMTAALFAAPEVIRRVNTAQLQASVSLARNTLEQSGELQRISAERAAIHDSVMPGVVHITQTAPNANDWQFQYGVGSTGTGWFWDKRGHIITNAHVVENGGRVRVELFDGRVRPASIVALDANTDIAILKINADGIIVPPRAHNTPVRVGDVAFLLGSPFGIKHSMSQGSVSGLNRAHGPSGLSLRTGYTNFIQTDAAMNPGNSGGPLVNASGKVIGMASAIANVAKQNNQNNYNEFAGQSAGIGFAIPLATVENIVSQYLDEELPVVIRGYLGVELREPTPTEARQAGLDGQGVRVERIVAGNPAAKGGLLTGDIIIAINNTPTRTMGVLQSLVSIQEPGEPIRVTVWRPNIGEETVSFRLGAATLDAAGRLNYLPGSEDMSVEEIYTKIRDNAEQNAQ